MPRVQIPVTVIDTTGEAQPALTNGDATNDHYVTGGADGRTLLEIVSTDGGAQTVEVVPSPTLVLPDGLTVNNLSIAVAAGVTVLAGPFRTSTYKQDTDNVLWVNPSVSSTLDFRAYRLPLPS
jgi:hypothetical protein